MANIVRTNRLTGQAAVDYLRDNPEAMQNIRRTSEDITQNQAFMQLLQQKLPEFQAQQAAAAEAARPKFGLEALGFKKPGGLLGGLAYGLGDMIASPLVETGRIGRDIAGELGQAAGMGDYDSYISDPGQALRSGMKIAGGIGQFAVPFGGSMKAAIGLGGLGGALGGLASTEEQGAGGILQDVATGAGFGAATGGLLKGLGGMFGKGAAAATPKGLLSPTASLDDIARYSDDLARTTQKTVKNQFLLQGLADDAADDAARKAVQTQFGASKSNQMMNFISQNFADQPQTQQRLFADLLKTTGGDDPLRAAIQGQLDIVSRGTAQQGTRGGLSKIGRKLELEGLGIKTPLTPTGASQATQLADDVGSIIQSKGRGLNPQGMADTFTDLSDDLTRTLQGSTDILDPTVTLDDFINRLADEGIDTTGGSAGKLVDRMTGKLGALGDDVTPQNLASFKKNLQSQLSPVFKKLERGNPLSDVEIVKKAMHDAVDNSLKTQVPEAASIYRQMSTLHKAAPDVIKAADKAGHVSLPLLLGGIKVPTAGIPGGIKSGIGKALQGKLPGAGIVSGLASKAAPILGSEPGQRVIRQGLVNTLMDGGQEVPPASPLTMSRESLFEAAAVPQAAPQAGGMPGMMGGQMGMMGAMAPQVSQEENLMRAAQLAMQIGAVDKYGKPEWSAIEGIAEMLGSGQAGGGGQRLPSAQVQQMNEAQASLQGLDELENAIDTWGGDYFGPVRGGLLGSVAQKFGLAGDRAGLNSQIGMLAQTIGRALEGGKLSDADIDRYREMLPNLADTPGNAKKKLQAVRNMVELQVSQSQQGFTQAGYNPFAGNAVGVEPANNLITSMI